MTMKRGLTVQEAGRLGGSTRAQKLSEEKRHAIAMKASEAARKRLLSLSPEEMADRNRRIGEKGRATRLAKKGKSV